MAPAEQRRERDPIDHELARRTVGTQLRVRPAIVLALPAIFLALAGNLPGWALATWLVFVVVDAIRGHLHLASETRRAESDEPDPRRLHRMASHAAVFGVVWGSIAVWVALTGVRAAVPTVFVLLLLLGAIFTAIASATKWLPLVMTASMLVVSAPAVWFSGEQGPRLVALGLLAFGSFTYLHLGLHSVLYESAVVRQRNIELAEELQEQIAGTDPLTGLCNRRGFIAAIERVVAERAADPLARSGEELTVVVANVRRLAAINELFGDDAGNEVLVAIAQRLGRLPSAAFAAARLGGDEFAVAALGVPMAAADPGLFLSVVTDEPIRTKKGDIDIALQVAHAAARCGSVAAVDLVTDATAHLRTRRAAARAPMGLFGQDTLSQRRELAEKVRAGLREAGIRPWFQPIVSSSDRSIVGWEALARWETAAGAIPTDRFLPLVGLSGRSHELLLLVVQGAAEFLGALDRLTGHDDPTSVHVNMTPEDLRRPNVVAEMLDVFRVARIDPGRLVVELTEQDILEIDETVVANLRWLNRFGARLAVDDFGTGFSSLTHLLELPTEVLKIDKRFVSVLPDDESASSLVTGMVGMARALGLTIVAEGIESEEQAACLAELGCQELQGHLVAPAMPQDEAVRFAVARLPLLDLANPPAV